MMGYNEKRLLFLTKYFSRFIVRKIETFHAKGEFILKSIKRFFSQSDWLLLFLCVACSTMSVTVLISYGMYETGSWRDAVVQGGASLMGIVAALILSRINYRLLANVWPVHVVFTWGLVLLTLLKNKSIGPITFGYAPSGTENYSWIRFGPLSLQPTELAKISFILTFAMHLDNVREKVNQPVVLGKLLLHLLIPAAIIHIQGDDGTMLIFLAIGSTMLFSAGISLKYVFSAITAAVCGVAFMLVTGKGLSGYQVQRVMALYHSSMATTNPQLYEQTMYQQDAGRISIGSGQIFGRGLFQPEHNWVPEGRNDFIFSYMAEGIGFVGCIIVLIVLFSIAFKTLGTALRSKEPLGAYICAGVFASLIFQIIVNLGMNLRLLPVIGVTLPFFSSGGSSALMMYLCMGLVLSVYSHNPKADDMFEQR